MKYRKTTALLFLIISFFLSPTSIYSEGKPSIVMEEASFDFGSAKQGEVISHQFRFKNNGTAPLKIGEVFLS